MVREKWINKRTAMALFVVVIMVASIGGFVLNSSYSEGGDAFRYKGIKFKRLQDTYVGEIDGQEVSFYFHPENVQHINLSQDVLDKLDLVYQVYMTSDPNSTIKHDIALVQYDFAPILDNSFNIYSSTAFTGENEFNIPIITCDNATDSIPVIEFQESDDIGISIDGNCIVIKGYDANSLLSVRDRLLYSMFKITE